MHLPPPPWLLIFYFPSNISHMLQETFIGRFIRFQIYHWGDTHTYIHTRTHTLVSSSHLSTITRTTRSTHIDGPIAPSKFNFLHESCVLHGNKKKIPPSYIFWKQKKTICSAFSLSSLSLWLSLAHVFHHAQHYYAKRALHLFPNKTILIKKASFQAFALAIVAFAIQKPISKAINTI